MRSKSKGWKKPKGKGKGKSSSSTGPSGTNAAGKKTGKCLDCGKYGHWKGDQECEHVKSGKTKPFRPHGANASRSTSALTLTMMKTNMIKIFVKPS